MKLTMDYGLSTANLVCLHMQPTICVLPAVPRNKLISNIALHQGNADTMVCNACRV